MSAPVPEHYSASAIEGVRSVSTILVVNEGSLSFDSSPLADDDNGRPLSHSEFATGPLRSCLPRLGLT